MVFVAFTLLDLFTRKDTARDRVNAAHVLGHVAICNAFDFQIVQAAKGRDLVKGQAGIVQKPNCGCLGHENVGHRKTP